MSEFEQPLVGYYSQDEVARMFSVSPRTIRTWTSQPDGLPYVDLGRRRLYPLAEIHAWVKSRVRRPNTRRRAA